MKEYYKPRTDYGGLDFNYSPEFGRFGHHTHIARRIRVNFNEREIDYKTSSGDDDYLRIGLTKLPTLRSGTICNHPREWNYTLRKKYAYCAPPRVR